MWSWCWLVWSWWPPFWILQYLSPPSGLSWTPAQYEASDVELETSWRQPGREKQRKVKRKRKESRRTLVRHDIYFSRLYKAISKLLHVGRFRHSVSEMQHKEKVFCPHPPLTCRSCKTGNPLLADRNVSDIYKIFQYAIIELLSATQIYSYIDCNKWRRHRRHFYVFCSKT